MPAVDFFYVSCPTKPSKLIFMEILRKFISTLPIFSPITFNQIKIIEWRKCEFKNIQNFLVFFSNIIKDRGDAHSNHNTTNESCLIML